jgi:hypothetical protein
VLRALLLALLLAAPAVLAASFAGRDPAVSSLRAAQRPDGGWGSRAATDWVLVALAASGEDVRRWGVEDHLVANPPDATSLLAWERSTLALACAGYDANDFHGLDYALVVQLGFVGGQFGSPSAVNDDDWGILALRAAGTPASDPRLQLSAQYVLAAERPGGGWSWSTTGPADPDDTGAALMALAAADAPGRGPAVARAVDHLQATRNADGGWGLAPGSPSNAMSTAWVAMGLLASGADAAAPLAWLASLQRADGGFAYAAGDAQETPVFTATALVPLLGASYDCRP